SAAGRSVQVSRKPGWHGCPFGKSFGALILRKDRLGPKRREGEPARLAGLGLATDAEQGCQAQDDQTTKWHSSLKAHDGRIRWEISSSERRRLSSQASAVPFARCQSAAEAVSPRLSARISAS